MFGQSAAAALGFDFDAGRLDLTTHPFCSGFGPTTEEAEAGSSMADLLPENFTPRQFADLCAKLTGTRVLVFLDEFDRCESSENRPVKRNSTQRSACRRANQRSSGLP